MDTITERTLTRAERPFAQRQTEESRGNPLAHFYRPEHRRVMELVHRDGLCIMHDYSDPKCLIMSSPRAGRYLKYVVDPLTHEPLDAYLQMIVLRGMKNQHELSDILGVQKTFTYPANPKNPSPDDFYAGIPGLLELQWMKGVNFRRFTKRRGAYLPPDEVERFAQGAYRIVNEINERGIMHRDIKPGNLILGRGGGYDVYAIDWSIAANPTEHAEDRTDDVMLGSFPYFKPTDDGFGVRDRYGLGISLLESLADDDNRRELKDIGRRMGYVAVGEWTRRVLASLDGKILPSLYGLIEELVYTRSGEASGLHTIEPPTPRELSTGEIRALEVAKTVRQRYHPGSPISPVS